MKKSITLFFALMLTVIVQLGCRETKEEKAEDAIEEVGDGLEEAGDEVEDAAKDVKEELDGETDDH